MKIAASRRSRALADRPNGGIFALEHTRGHERIMISQLLASPIAGGMGRLCLRTSDPEPLILPLIGPESRCRAGVANDRFVWEWEASGVILVLLPIQVLSGAIWGIRILSP
jgi:1,2-beta-oligoglucan phosphorylase